MLGAAEERKQSSIPFKVLFIHGCFILSNHLNNWQLIYNLAPEISACEVSNPTKYSPAQTTQIKKPIINVYLKAHCSVFI